MDYNKYNYYRSNPYHHIGNIPPIGHSNRKPMEFSSEIPQGLNHLEKIGRKQFGNNNYSHIQE